MGNFIIGFDPVSTGSVVSAAVVMVNHSAGTEQPVVVYHGRPYSKRKMKKEIKKAAKYYGASLKEKK